MANKHDLVKLWIKRAIFASLVGLVALAGALVPSGQTVYAADFSVSKRIQASADDCTFRWSDGASAWTIGLADTYGSPGFANTNYYKVGYGMRFVGVNIPDDAQITSVNIDFECIDGQNGVTVNTVFYGEETATAAAFSTVANYQSRRGTIVGGANNNNITSANITWDGIGAWTAGTAYSTPDAVDNGLVTIIQEIVDDCNGITDLGLFWDDHGNRSSHVALGYRAAKTYNADVNKCPQITITWRVKPTVQTDAATLVEEETATLNGQITATGGVDSTVRGFEWDTDSGAPYANDWHEHGSYGIAAFTHDLTGLTKGEAYYYRAYATNTAGTAYGAEQKFLTKPDPPTALDAQFLSSTSLRLTWASGTGADVTSVRALEGAYPAADRSDGAEVYNGALLTYDDVGLDNGDHWYYRAWSYCSEDGMSQYSDDYSQDNEITTATPKVETQPATDIAATTATLNGDIQLTGGQNCTTRGFEWDTDSGAPYANDQHQHGSYGVASYTEAIIGLPSSTTIYFRFYASNPAGISYADEHQFDTLAPLPLAPTNLAGICSEDNIEITWTMGIDAVTTIYIHRGDRFPTSLTDGEEVYNGADDNFTHLGVLTESTEGYYSAWSHNPTGYSLDYATLKIGGEPMTNALLMGFGGFILLGLGILGLVQREKLWPASIISGIGWFGFAIWCSTQQETSSLYWTFAAVSGLIGIFFIAVPIYMRRSPTTETEDNQKTVFKEAAEIWGSADDETMEKWYPSRRNRRE